MWWTWVVVTASVGYLTVLFAIAYCGDRRAGAGRSLINNGTIYALSLGVYATSWTFYGSVGWAAGSGMGFLSIYLGPTLMFALGWVVLRKIIRISRRNRITSLADFISARYGKSTSLGGLITVVAVVGIVPYISLQLKAVSSTFEFIRRHPAITAPDQVRHVPLPQDTALYVALLLAGFAIIFGTRHVDATERHEGMVAAIAFESVVKLVAFLAAGVFVTFGLFRGFGDVFSRASAHDLAAVSKLATGQGYGDWVWLIVLSMLAIVLLPRQWQVTVVENVDERHLKRAIWLFPLYLLVISVFVPTIAAAGLLRLGNRVDADTYVLALPMMDGQVALALLVFVGGLSAGTGMIIVETVAISTMVSNSLVLPTMLRTAPRMVQRLDAAKLVLGIRRLTIVVVMLLGYGYFRLAGEGTGLASIGLVSFAAVAQFAPALLGGLYWKGGTRNGALAGTVAGFAVWAYTMLVPTFADAGWLPAAFLRDGAWGVAALRPQALFGLSGMNPVSHGMFWSMFVNIGCYVGTSLLSRPTPAEQAQTALFLDTQMDPARVRLWRGGASFGELRALLERFLSPVGLEALDTYARARGLDTTPTAVADRELVHHAETMLAGSIGAASARLVVASLVEEAELGVADVMEMIDEASHVAALEERHRLARELHDSVSQVLFSMTLHTRAVELAVQRGGGDFDGRVARGLANLRSLTQGALAEMRASIFQLRPEALDEEGLAAAIRRSAATIATREGLDVQVDAPEERMPLDGRAEEYLFRIVQEAMHNVVKHAAARRIDIRLHEDATRPGTLVIEVIDDGTGFDPSASQRGHLGIDGMRERARHLGGHLVVDSSPTGSTTIRAVVPGILRRPDADRLDR